MFDIPSDAILSDLDFEHANNHEIAILRQENQKLVQINRDLTNQLRVLREQFDQALSVTSDLDDRFAKHNETSRKLEEIKLERDDLRDRLEVSARTISDLTNQIHELRKNSNPQPTVFTQKLSQLKDQVKQMNMERENAENQSILETQKHEKAMKSVLKTVSSFLGTDIEDAKELASFVKHQKHSYAQLLKMVKKVKKENGALYRQIEEVSNMNESHMVRIRNLEERNNELTLTSNISPRKMANTTSEIFTQANLNTTRIANSEMEETMAEQRDTIDALRSERNKLTNLLERQSELTRSLEQKLATAEGENNEMTKELKDTRNKLRKATKFENNEANIPLSFWQCPDFPEELLKLVEEIAKNSSMQTPTKIRHALTTVSNWYGSRQLILEKDLKEKREALDELTKQSATLVEYLRHVMPFDVDFSKLMTDEYARNSLGRKMADLQNQVHEYSAEIAQMRNVMDTLNVDDAGMAMNSIKTLQTAEQENANLKKQLHEQDVIQKKQIDELRESMNIQKENFTREINELKDKVKRKKEKISAMKISNEQERVHAETEQKETIQAITTELQTKISDLNQSNELLLISKNDELEIVQRQLKAALEEIEQCKNVISKLRKRKSRAENEFQLCNEQKQSFEQEMTRKMKHQKQKSQQRINEVLEKLKQNTTESNNTISILNAKLADLEEKNTLLSSQCTDISLKLQKAETRATSVAAECERDKKQLESSYTAKIQSIEINYKQQLDASAADQESWRRRIYSNMSMILAKHLDGTRQIDDFNFESCLQTVKRKLEAAISANNRIRGILEIGPYENLESAVQSLMCQRKRK